MKNITCQIKTILVLICLSSLPSKGGNHEDSVVVDIEGNKYHTIAIGTQIWMKENLRTTKYNNGTPIFCVESNNEWTSLSSAAYCWYNNDSSYQAIYGAIYNGFTLEEGNVCPTGWHVPTDNDWKILEIELGMSPSEADKPGWRGNIGGKFAGAANLWLGGYFEGDTVFNTTAFNGVPAGNRIGESGSFGNMGSNAYWWCNTDEGKDKLWVRNIFYASNHFIKNSYSKNYGFSIRCIKDN